MERFIGYQSSVAACRVAGAPKRRLNSKQDNGNQCHGNCEDRSRLLAFFELAGAGVIQLTSSAFAIEEARRNIALKRPDRIAAYERLIAELSPAPAPPGELIAIARAAGLPPKDAPILAAALAAEADLLVTGDRTHFGKRFGQAIGRLTVRKPAEALATIVHAARLKAALQRRK